MSFITTLGQKTCISIFLGLVILDAPVTSSHDANPLQIGWTLWNISIGALFSGSSMVLYDGSPFYPGPEKFLVSLLALG